MSNIFKNYDKGPPPHLPTAAFSKNELFHTPTSAARKIGIKVDEVNRLIRAGVLPLCYFQPSKPVAKPKLLIRPADVARMAALFALQGIPKEKRSTSRKGRK